MNKFLLNEILNIAPRLLSLLDRRPFSSTAGSFDKSYWHFKTTDFSNSAAQMAMETLAHLWSIKDSKNLFYQNENILKYIKESLHFTCEIQHNDGSFDEWYFNEKGWAGPTGYVLQSICQTYLIIQSELSQEEKDKTINTIKRASKHLSRRDEKDILANHIAVTIMSLSSAWKVTGIEEIKKDSIKWWNYFKKYISNEGWSLEYDGVDIGYNFATLSFLARAHQVLNLGEIKDYCKTSFQFLHFFFYPDGTFGGTIGSRNTTHLYPFAIEYWSDFIPTAQTIKKHISQFSDILITPSIQDDHYLMYRSNDYLDAYKYNSKSNSTTSKGEVLPYQREGDFSHVFPEAGIIIKKINSTYFLTNLKKGGCFYIFNIPSKVNLIKDSGVIGKFNRKTLTSSISTSSWNSIIDTNRLKTSRNLENVRDKVFSPTKSIIFKIVLLTFGKSTYLSYLLKRLIRKILIVGESPSKLIYFEREFSFSDNKISVLDTFKGSCSGDIITNKNFAVRYVPQSQYFHTELLQESPNKLKKKLNEDLIHTREWTI